MPSSGVPREQFGSSFGVLAAMIGVAVGLGNVWRFPYMTGRFGGAAFVLVYVAIVTAVGIPALMAEWALGRETARGPVGAYGRAGLPFGRFVGWLLFAVVLAATGYYTNVVGWVLYHAAAPALGVDPADALPPPTGFRARSLVLQLAGTAAIILGAAAVVTRGVRRGAEAVSRILTPLLFAALIVVLARAVTLPGAGAGVAWFLGRYDPTAITPGVVFAALGQAVFSLALGGTFMVAYGSYLARDISLARHALWTAVGDTTAGILAGLALFPAIFAVGLEVTGGPDLLFRTLPVVFDRLPAGAVVGTVFYVGLGGVGFLSVIAALETLVAGVLDTTSLTRRAATWGVTAAVFALAVPPMINMRVFVPWDLTFGSGMQTFGALCAAATVGWALGRANAIRALGSPVLYYWVRWVIPLAILGTGVWWATSLN